MEKYTLCTKQRPKRSFVLYVLESTLLSDMRGVKWTRRSFKTIHKNRYSTHTRTLGSITSACDKLRKTTTESISHSPATSAFIQHMRLYDSFITQRPKNCPRSIELKSIGTSPYTDLKPRRTITHFYNSEQLRPLVDPMLYRR